MRDDSAEILFQSFLQEALSDSSGMGRYVRSLVLSIQNILCRPRRRTPSKVPGSMVLERLSWRVTCSNHARFHLFDSCQERFLWTHGEADLVPNPVVVLVLQIGETKKFSHAPGFKSLDPLFFFRVSKQGPCFTTMDEGGGGHHDICLCL